MKTCKQLESILNEDTCWASISVYDSTLDEMARIGKLPNSKLEIHMEPGEGNTPHFHIQIKNGKKENCICHVKILSAEYFRDKDDPMNTLDTHERKALAKYMESNLSGLPVTNWEVIAAKWNEFNPSHKVKIDKTKMPDYRELKEEDR